MTRFIPLFLFACLLPHPAHAHGISLDGGEWLGMAGMAIGPGLLLSLVFMKGDMRVRLTSAFAAGIIGFLLSPLVFVGLLFMSVAAFGVSNLLVMWLAIVISRKAKSGGTSPVAGIAEWFGRIGACLVIGIVLVFGAKELQQRVATDMHRSELREKARNGDGFAQLELGRVYLEKGENAKATEFLLQAAQKNTPGAAFALAELYERGASAEAVTWYTKAAEAEGDERAAYALGGIYRDGRGVAQDGKLAIEWFEKAAAMPGKWTFSNDMDAMIRIADIYEAGKIVPKDLVKAYVYYHAAETASRGRYRADYARTTLAQKMSPEERAAAEGQMNEKTAAGPEPQAARAYYERAEGIYLQDTYGESVRHAIMYFRLAGERGHAEAANYLGNIYTRGARNVPQDYKEAYYWFTLCIKRYGGVQASGFAERCEDNRKNAASALDDAARGEIEKRVADFTPVTKVLSAAELEAMAGTLPPRPDVIVNDPLAPPPQ